MNDEPKLSEVLEAVKAQQAYADERFDEVLGAVKDGFGLMDEKFVKVDERLDAVDERLDRVERKLDRVDGKVNVLVSVLHEKHVITEDDKRNIHA